MANTARTISCKAWNFTVEYPSRESKHGIKESEDNTQWTPHSSSFEWDMSVCFKYMGQSDYGVVGLHCTSSSWKKVKWTMDVVGSVACGSKDAVLLSIPIWCFILTSSNGTIFHITGHLCGEFTGPQWIPRTKASDTELWFFFICVWINGCVNNREAGD